MSSSNCVTPVNDESQIPDYACRANKNICRMKFEFCLADTWSQHLKDNHRYRMGMLRCELDHIQSTDWMYRPIEKYLGLTQATKHKT